MCTSAVKRNLSHHRHYPELNESRQSRSWASQYPIVCLLLSTYIQPLVRARKLSMHSEFCVATVWMTHRCRLSSAPSSSPSCSMHQVHGGDSQQQQTGFVSTHLSDVAHAVVLYHVTCHRSKLSAVLLMMNCLKILESTLITFFIVFYHRSRARRRIIIFVRAVTTWNFPIVSAVLRIVTLSNECSIRTYTRVQYS